MSKALQEEVRAILVKYHSSDGQTNAVAVLQLRVFVENIGKKPFWDYSLLFKDQNARAFLSLYLCSFRMLIYME